MNATFRQQNASCGTVSVTGSPSRVEGVPDTVALAVVAVLLLAAGYVYLA